MPDDVACYPRYRFPPTIISHAVCLYYRFSLSFRDVEDLSLPESPYVVGALDAVLRQNHVREESLTLA